MGLFSSLFSRSSSSSDGRYYRNSHRGRNHYHRYRKSSFSSIFSSVFSSMFSNSWS